MRRLLVLAALGAALITPAAAQAASTTVEGESLTATPSNSVQVRTDATASNGQILAILGNGSSQSTVTLPASGTLSMRVADRTCTGGPHMVVYSDSTVLVDTILNYADFAYQTLTFNVDVPAGSHVVKVTFDNDLANQTCDRNIYLDKLTFSGPDSCTKRTTWDAGAADGTDSHGESKYIYTPPSDSSICVTQTADATSRGNATPNAYVPSDTELTAFRAALDDHGATPTGAMYYPGTYVTGRNNLGLHPSTDDLIEFYAKKWGIPEDWLRAEYVQESDWRQGSGTCTTTSPQPYGCGDLRTETSSDWTWYHNAWANYCPTSTQCWESIGITQIKARPNGSSGAGTDPLRRLSTSFNIDYQASVVRFEYDNPQGKRGAWGDNTQYSAHDEWGSIGAWFSPYTFNNSSALSYISAVQTHLTNQDWTGY